jgi:hypothetical protein
MDIRLRIVLVSLSVAALSTGCRKSPPAETAPASQPVASKTEVSGAQPTTDGASKPGDAIPSRFHWLGKKRVAAETNARSLMAVWSLAESVKLEQQTLDKLSRAPWLKSQPGNNANASALLRPVLDDVLQEESYLEMRHATNQPVTIAFAIRLGDDRARLWETNLAVVLESLTGIRPSRDANGWSLRKSMPASPSAGYTNLITLTRAGGWTLFGQSPDPTALVAELVERIKSKQVPFSTPPTNDWLQADFDLRELARVLAPGCSLPAATPRVSLTVNGDSQYVVTRGELAFPMPLFPELEAWAIPTNLLEEQLGSFTAMRDLRPWLDSLESWKKTQVSETPDQFYLWSLRGAPIQSFFAAPVRDANNEVQEITHWLVEKWNPLLSTNSMGGFAPSTEFSGAVWTGVPFMWPQIRARSSDGRDYVYGGLMANVETDAQPPADLIQQVLGRTNLVLYDWEIIGPRIEHWFYIGQLIRVILNKPQLPSDSLGVFWLKAAAPNLGNSVTAVTRTGPDHLGFVRGATVGLTAVELHLLVDWLESPQFPFGLYTFTAPAPATQ